MKAVLLRVSQVAHVIETEISQAISQGERPRSNGNHRRHQSALSNQVFRSRGEEQRNYLVDFRKQRIPSLARVRAGRATLQADNEKMEPSRKRRTCFKKHRGGRGNRKAKKGRRLSPFLTKKNQESDSTMTPGTNTFTHGMEQLGMQLVLKIVRFHIASLTSPLLVHPRRLTWPRLRPKERGNASHSQRGNL